MARKRMIDPSIWADERFGRLSAEGQVMFMGMISNADDEGRLSGNAAYLGATIFPFRGLTQKESSRIRDEVLKVMRSVKLYEVDGCEYLELSKFSQYQVINKPSRSKYPPLSDKYGSATVVLPPNRIEENRIEEEEKNSPKKINSLALSRGQIMVFLKEFPGLVNQDIKEQATKCSQYMSASSESYKNPGLFFRGWLRKFYAEWRKEKAARDRERQFHIKHQPISPEQFEANKKRIEELKAKFPIKRI